MSWRGGFDSGRRKQQTRPGHLVLRNQNTLVRLTEGVWTARVEGDVTHGSDNLDRRRGIFTGITMGIDDTSKFQLGPILVTVLERCMGEAASRRKTAICIDRNL